MMPIIRHCIGAKVNKDPSRNFSPTELGFSGFGNLFGYKAEQKPFTGEPARTNHITLRPTHEVPSRVTAR